MKANIWFIILLIFWSGCASKPVVSKIYSTSNTGIYLSIRAGKGVTEIDAVYSMDSVAKVMHYLIDHSVKEYSKAGNTYNRIERMAKYENDRVYPYLIDNGRLIFAERLHYSSEDFINENPFYKNFFEFLSPDFKSMNNAGRVKFLDSLAQFDW